MNHPAKLPATNEAAVFFHSILGFVVAVLVMVGVGGTLYKLITPGGWLAQLWGRSMAGGMAALLAFTLIGLSIWLLRAWVSVGQRNRYSEVFVYAFAGAGALYCLEVLMAK